MFARSQEWPLWLCVPGLTASPLTRALSVPHTFLKSPRAGKGGWLAKVAAVMGRRPGAGCGLQAAKAKMGQPWWPPPCLS